MLNKIKNQSISFLPLIATFLILLLTFLGWQFLKKTQDDYINQVIQTKAENIRNTVNIYMQERTNSFLRLTYRWTARAQTPENEWRSDVTHYIQDQPGYQAIEWADNSLHVRWVVPESEHQHSAAYNLLEEPQLRKSIEKAMSKKTMTLTPLIQLIQGGNGVLLFSPLYKKTHFEGFIIGIINTQLMLEHLIQPERIKGYNVSINNGSQVIYSSNSMPFPYGSWSKTADFYLLDQHWNITVSPTKVLFQQIKEYWFPLIMLLTGTVLALLFGFFLQTQLLLKVSSKKLNKTQRYLADANDRLNGIIEGSEDLIAAVDLQLNFIAFNSKYQREILRVFKVQLQLGMNFDVLLERMHIENQNKTLKLWSKAFEGQSFTIIESFHDKRFPGLYYEIHYNPIRNSKNELIGASHIAINVEKRILNEQKIAHSKEQLENLVISLENQNKELILLKEMMGLLQSSLSFETILQPISTYTKNILKSTSGVIFLIDKHNPDHFQKVTTWGHPLVHQSLIIKSDCWALLRGQLHEVSQKDDAVWCHHVSAHRKKPHAYICRPMYAQGEILGLFYMEISNEEDTTNNRLIYLAQILSEQIALSFYNIKLKEELTIESTHDSLTGLYNRRFFEEYLQKQLINTGHKSTTFALLLIDIDHFKKINDLHGHLFGDKVLQCVAEQLSKNCRKNDLLCRWGGEEFFLLLQDTFLSGINKRAETIRQSVETLVFNHNTQIDPITISIGVSFYPENGQDLDTLTENADRALYQAKKEGRNKVVIYTHQNQR